MSIFKIRCVKKIILTNILGLSFLIPGIQQHANAQTFISESIQPGSCPIVVEGKATPVYTDNNDFIVVQIAARELSKDIERVTGFKPAVFHELSQLKKTVIIIGTIGNSTLIDDCIRQGKIDVSRVRGQWETYQIQVVDNPVKGIDRAVVILGSDRRGTAYGVFELSKQIGVSPWYWWADIAIEKKSSLFVNSTTSVFGPPSVKYRGIFINDEDWGISPWAKKTFEPKVADIGPKTYAKICELLLRLKANYLWPAMHECTRAFNMIPENKFVADSFAIVMGSSHCEPLLYNNATEWNTKNDGVWDYGVNKTTIYNKLNQRVAENGRFENVYTVGIRGLHDQGMLGNYTQPERIKLMEEVIADERQILTKQIGKPADSIPQIFIPYKEVLPLYENGLRVPDDVTIMWVDDNYGYIRNLGSPEEQNRKGGCGVYYHISYLGAPHEYLWLNTVQPALLYEEMKKAYDNNAKRVWVVNVGDIKPGEYGTEFFLDLAWNINCVNYDNMSTHLALWLNRSFGEKTGSLLLPLMQSYYHLGFIRKPEFMGFGREWGGTPSKEQITDTEFSFANYNEAEKRVAGYNHIQNQTKKIYESLANDKKAGFFELIYYPVTGASLMNKKLLTAQQNRWYARQKRAKTNTLANLVRQYEDSLELITDQYNSLLGGKWRYMMSIRQHNYSSYYEKAPVDSIKMAASARMSLFVEGNDNQTGVNNIPVLPCFNPFFRQSHFIDVYNKGSLPFQFKIATSEKWIRVNENQGEVADETRLWVNIDWSYAPEGNASGKISITGAGTVSEILVNLFNPLDVTAESLKECFVESNGFISMNPDEYTRPKAGSATSFRIINDLGITGNSVQITGKSKDPCLEYDFYSFNSGVVDLYTYVLPVFSISKERSSLFSVSIDNEPLQSLSTQDAAEEAQWNENVLRNVKILHTRHVVDKPGRHTLKIWAKDPNVVIQKMIIDFGGLKQSYSGPETTRLK